MIYYAHSPKDCIPAQEYTAHVNCVMCYAKQHMDEVYPHAALDGEMLRSVVSNTAAFHDLGKLDQDNQKVLSREKSGKTLPKNHVDAGVAYFLSQEQPFVFSAVTIGAHHIGLPSFSVEANKEEAAFRDTEIMADNDRALPELEKIHKSLVPYELMPEQAEGTHGDMSVFLRMALSCVSDADHTDTALNYKNIPDSDNRTLLRAEERLRKLDDYVAGLKKDNSQRTLLRDEMYAACRNADVTANICSCDSPVGSGKTTAIMAHLLEQASRRGLRRIFVILPFTNIITQSVQKYREALVLPGERPDEVVAELHHRADFESEDARHLTALWRVPIIVTTAVTFFETLASNSTATLRRLHELPGSAVFIDESHAALPSHLLPVAWRWINVYANEWNCYWLLASGSLSRFWTIDEIAHNNPVIQVPEIVSEDLRMRLAGFENQRITYRHDLTPKSVTEVADWITGFPGPRLVILNTVQNAAVLANHFCQKFGRERVEHLSTALTATDRERTLCRVRERLALKTDTDWTFIATSCVEAGVDLSFRTGFRELGSLVSLLQAAGRINRNGSPDNDSEIWTFCLAQSNEINSNPGIKDAADILYKYFTDGVEIQPSLSTKSINDEIKLKGLSAKHEKLMENEMNQSFTSVEEEFRVIDSTAKICIVDKEMAERIKYGKINWRELQKNSVQVPKYTLERLNTKEILDGIYYWSLGYNSFIGYMAGIVQLKALEANSMII